MTYTQLTDLIKSKKFDYVNSNITNDLFPIPEKIGTEYRVYNFTNNYSSEEIVALISVDGFTPATIWDLLNWKEWNGKYDVVALGSSAKVNGHRGVPCLGRCDSGGHLFLDYWGGDWGADYRFLAVRTSSLRPFDTLSGTSDTLTLDKPWYITGRGEVVKDNGKSMKIKNRQVFLGAYRTKEEAEQARDAIKLDYGE